MNDMITNSILEQIETAVSGLINPTILNCSKLEINPNNDKSLYYSLTLTIEKSDYVVERKKSLILRIYKKFDKIAINDDFENRLIKMNIDYTKTKSDNFCKIDLSKFLELAEAPDDKFVKLINDIVVRAICVPTFGCCDLYEKCSDKKQCIHSDYIYSLGCQYNKNIKNNKIFYGKNRNI